MAENIYVISDIHGQYDALMEMMKKISFGYDDELYILGDAIDRGDKSLECVRWILENDNVLTLMGNHELLFLDNYLHNQQGIYNTINEARENLEPEKIREIADWIMDMPECRLIKVGARQFFLHHTQAASADGLGGELTERMFPEYSMYVDYWSRKCGNVLSVHGHIPTINMRIWNHQPKKFDIWYNEDKSIIDIDCGAGYPEQGGMLGCLRLNDFKEFYVKLRK